MNMAKNEPNGAKVEMECDACRALVDKKHGFVQ